MGSHIVGHNWSDLAAAAAWDNIEHANICIIGIPEGEERENRIGNVFEKSIAENIPNLKKKTYPDIRSPEGPKQDEPKQTYTYNNKYGKS